VMVLAFIVNKTRQSPDRNRIPAAPLSAFTSPIPVSANAVNLRSICARVAAESLRHWRTAADVNSIYFTDRQSHIAMNKSTIKSRNAISERRRRVTQDLGVARRSAIA